MTRWTWLCLMLMVAAPAWAWGPVVSGGAVVTLQQSTTTSSGTTVAFSHLIGPVARVGFELGDRFNHELAFQWSLGSGEGDSGGTRVPVAITTLGGSYTFSVDLFTKQGLDGLRGFTPTLGIGLVGGAARVNVQSIERWGPFLELHAMVGARYTFSNGLGLKLELVGSTYGGFFAVQPALCAAWRF